MTPFSDRERKAGFAFLHVLEEKQDCLLPGQNWSPARRLMKAILMGWEEELEKKGRSPTNRMATNIS